MVLDFGLWPPAISVLRNRGVAALDDVFDEFKVVWYQTSIPGPARAEI